MPFPKLLIHNMKNLIWIVPLALIAIVGYSAMGSYNGFVSLDEDCLLYTSPSPRDLSTSRMPSSA